MNYKKIQLIYDHLCDDISRMIFEKRLEYSLSGSYHKIDEMVNLELYRYGDSDILNRCMDWIRKNNIEKVSVFGAGNAGHQIVHILKSNKIPVEKVYDNNEKKWGDKCDGVPICSSKEISAGEYIIIGVDYYREDIMQQLQILGVERNNMFIPDALWKMGDCSQYFDKRIMKPSESEIFVDGGCLDGEDSKAFAEWCNGKYECIYAFEPESTNQKKIMTMTKAMDRFEVYPMGLWSEKATLKFISGNRECCMISKKGDILIEVDSIDNVLDGKRVTYIKMDIEGSEMEALKGAEKTIKAFKPRLAICVYHKPEDIIDIPLKILELNPNYKLYLRHYSFSDLETVLYAI